MKPHLASGGRVPPNQSCFVSASIFMSTMTKVQRNFQITIPKGCEKKPIFLRIKKIKGTENILGSKH